ncbi:MAG: hypothetical protein KF819_07435 [Labilithrix sp.]|nr:hypothetical protein [Labilithrix sp.]
MSRSTLLTSLLALFVAAPFAAGCAADTDAEDASEEQVAETQDELTAAAAQLVGSYWTHAPAFGGFGRLALKANGRYTAQVDPAGTAFCITSPCLLPESGTWNATRKAGGGYRVRIRANGAPSRWYDAVKSGGFLELTRAGKTETLNVLGAGACLDDADCKANEACGPKVCLMWCAVGDPFCCGPSTCQPKAPPPPPPACWGAWLDQFGNCRTPADGVYPDSCCAGQTTPCGDAACGVGTTCCNPLAGICTKPGDFCAM